MAIENTVPTIFDPCSLIVKSVFDCLLSGVINKDQSWRGAIDQKNADLLIIYNFQFAYQKIRLLHWFLGKDNDLIDFTVNNVQVLV